MKSSDSVFSQRAEKAVVVVVDSITNTEIVISMHTQTHGPFLLKENIHFFAVINNRIVPIIIPQINFLSLPLNIKKMYIEKIFPKQFAFLNRSKYVNGLKQELVPNFDEDYIRTIYILR
ncbi:hypothetical protein ACFSPU_00910 [Haoranjiania flava]|uniref:Uncharacterized protein n=1 Tax=Haoranjiania flava TaxID=1856322 RepID=A0AAE3IQH5_9BACT|nr:hypothetical protein [Haoranjiania flava]MCU7693947.1 hypothetical protein [Haoranjiania flava]